MKNHIKMKICDSAYNAIIDFIGFNKAESGGILFGSEEDYVVRKFIPDIEAITSRNTYTINADYLNPIIDELWEKEHLSVIGIIHSHQYHCKYLSGPDNKYFHQLRKKLPRKIFFTPIVFTIPDGGFNFFPYVYFLDSQIPVSIEKEIVPDDYKSDQQSFNIPQTQGSITHIHYNYYQSFGSRISINPFWNLILVAFVIVGYATFFFCTVYFLLRLIDLILKIFM